MTPEVLRVSRSFITEAEIAAVTEVLRRGFLGMGTEVKFFETELQQYLADGGEAPRVACVNTGTAALHLATQALGIGPGDEVLIPSLTYVASFQAVSATGAKAVACDVRDEDGLLDLADAARRLTSRTRAVMPVHYASQIGDLEAIYRFASENGLRVIEDAAHSIGCRYRGKKIGTLGDVVAFSFDGIKNFTSGEGGAVVTRDAEVHRRVCDARLLGVEKDTEQRFAGQRSWEFEVSQQGWRYHMSDIMAAIGRVQLGRLEHEFAPRRIELAQRYRESLENVPGLRFFPGQFEPGIVPFMLPIRVPAEKRDALRAQLAERRIETGIHYKPSHLLARFRGTGPALPIAERLYEELISLPLHPQVTEADVDRVAAVLRNALSGSPHRHRSGQVPAPSPTA